MMFEATLLEAPKLLRIICFETVLRSSVANPLPQEISRTSLKILNFSQKVAKYEKKVNTGKFGKGNDIYILVLSKVPTAIPFGTEILKTAISR